MNPWNAEPGSPSDTYFRARASQALQKAFASITTPSLATYLFSATPRIPAEAFSMSLVLNVTNKLTHTGLSDPRRAFSGPMIVHKPRTESGTLDIVLTPLKDEGDSLLGVVSVSGIVRDNPVMPFVAALRHGIQRGRFVYNVANRHLVCVLDVAGLDTLGVVSAKWVGDGARERLFFAIPRRRYSFYDMPRMAMVLLTNMEYRIADIHDAEEQTDAFDMSDMMKAIEGLGKGLSGVYYGPDAKRDVINLSTGELSSRESGKVVSRLSVADKNGQCKIRRMIAQDYFLRLLPPGSERWFTTENGPYDKAVVPEIIPVVESMAQPITGFTQAEIRRRKEEDRRIRNRVSAAKSNEKRKQREIAQFKQLEMLKKKKRVLQSKHNRLLDENRALREKLLPMIMSTVSSSASPPPEWELL